MKEEQTQGSDSKEKARDIIAEISRLYIYNGDGYAPKGYGNWELNKATDAMYAYIQELEKLKL